MPDGAEQAFYSQTYTAYVKRTGVDPSRFEAPELEPKEVNPSAVPEVGASNSAPSETELESTRRFEFQDGKSHKYWELPTLD